MITVLQKNIEKTLQKALTCFDKEFFLRKRTPLLYAAIQSFLKKRAKRLRPLLLVISYLGYARKASRMIYHGAAGFELLHNCALIHDDIIDGATVRRNAPTMHEYFSNKYPVSGNTYCTGRNLALITGDILYAMGIKEFLKMNISSARTRDTLDSLLSAVVYTGIGEFKELLATTQPIRLWTKEHIYSLYDLKTGMYTFCYPLIIGNTLAGKRPNDRNTLMRLGRILGRAFQTRDDINNYLRLGKTSDKDTFLDISSSKPTLPLLFMYRAARRNERHFIERCMKKSRLTKSDKHKLYTLITQPIVWQSLSKEIDTAVTNAYTLIQSLTMKERSKKALYTIIRRLFS